MRGLTAEEILWAADAPGSYEFGEFAAAVSSPRSVGREDAALLQLRAATFGPSLACVTDCPACGAALEFDVPIDGLLAAETVQQPSYRWSGLGADVEYRLPARRDLEAIGRHQDPAAAESALFAGLVLAATLDGQPVEASELPPHVVDAVAADMAEHDPQAEMLFGLTCADCRHTWPALFDIERFFREELQAAAQRLLGEVHVLARAYGWREADILALSPKRRSLYIDLLAAGSGARLT